MVENSFPMFHAYLVAELHSSSSLISGVLCMSRAFVIVIQLDMHFVSEINNDYSNSEQYVLVGA